jgi:hypothetical protein
MTKKTGSVKIREMLDNMKAQGGLLDDWQESSATIGDVVSTHWTAKDIKHYLATETDNVRLARWCQLFLELDY